MDHHLHNAYKLYYKKGERASPCQTNIEGVGFYAQAKHIYDVYFNLYLAPQALRQINISTNFLTYILDVMLTSLPGLSTIFLPFF